MDYMTLKEASEKWGVTPSMDKLLLCCIPYSRSHKNGDSMVNLEERRKAY